MATPAISAELVPSKLDEKLEAAAKISPKKITNTVRIVMAKAHRRVVLRTPVGWSGALRENYSVEIRQPNTRHVRGVLANPILYHDVREEGRRPGKRPPIEPLIPWVGSKLGIPAGDRRRVAYLVARKIGAAGYPGAHMVAEGWDDTRSEIKPLLKDLGLAIVRRMEQT